MLSAFVVILTVLFLSRHKITWEYFLWSLVVRKSSIKETQSCQPSVGLPACIILYLLKVTSCIQKFRQRGDADSNNWRRCYVAWSCVCRSFQPLLVLVEVVEQVTWGTLVQVGPWAFRGKNCITAAVISELLIAVEMSWEWRETLKMFVQTRPGAASERELVKCWEMEQSKYQEMWWVPWDCISQKSRASAEDGIWVKLYSSHHLSVSILISFQVITLEMWKKSSALDCFWKEVFQKPVSELRRAENKVPASESLTKE